MSDQEGDDDQVAWRFDALLLKLLKTPPQSCAEVAEAARRAKGNPTRTRKKMRKRSRVASAPLPLGQEYRRGNYDPLKNRRHVKPDLDLYLMAHDEALRITAPRP
jgi:hypothetical protein